MSEPQTQGQTEAQNSVASSDLFGDVRVWQVRELVDDANDPRKRNAQDCFVLAASAKEACEIVGEDERRSIVTVHEVCPISKLPGDRYVVAQSQRTQS
jgi:hypothetical protein